LRHAAQYLHLDVDIENLDPLEGYRLDPGNHTCPRFVRQGICAGFDGKGQG
jgi:hypothetical protein